jgi:hypothetical protein
MIEVAFHRIAQTDGGRRQFAMAVRCLGKTVSRMPVQRGFRPEA